MTEMEVENFRSGLETKKAELTGTVIPKCKKNLAEAESKGEKEVAGENLERVSQLLREVEAALKRIEKGLYGKCLREECDKEISLKRLTVVPWAPHCIECTEIIAQEQSNDHAKKSRKLTRYTNYQREFQQWKAQR